MYDFWLGTATNKIGLGGASKHETIAGTHRLFKGSQADVIEELLTLELNDKAAGVDTIEECLDLIENVLESAKLYALEGIGTQVVLHIEPVDDDVWESPVINGWIDYSGSGEPVNDHLRGSMGITIQFMA